MEKLLRLLLKEMHLGNVEMILDGMSKEINIMGLP